MRPSGAQSGSAVPAKHENLSAVPSPAKVMLLLQCRACVGLSIVLPLQAAAQFGAFVLFKRSVFRFRYLRSLDVKAVNI